LHLSCRKQTEQEGSGDEPDAGKGIFPGAPS